MEVTTTIYSSFQRSDCKYAKSWTARFPILNCTLFRLVCTHVGWTARLNYTMTRGRRSPVALRPAPRVSADRQTNRQANKQTDNKQLLFIKVLVKFYYFFLIFSFYIATILW